MNKHHLANEIMIYLLSQALIFYSSVDTNHKSKALVAYIFISVFLVWLFANLVFITW